MPNKVVSPNPLSLGLSSIQDRLKSIQLKREMPMGIFKEIDVIVQDIDKMLDASKRSEVVGE